MSSETNNSDNSDNKHVSFQWFLDKVKNDEMTWEIFFQMMKMMISDDFSKSEEFNFVLLEELKGFKAVNNILKMENGTLSEERNELQNKVNSQAILLQKGRIQ